MTRPTTDNRPADSIRDAFEAMIAFLTILIGGPMPRAWPEIAAVAARAIGSQARNRPNSMIERSAPPIWKSSCRHFRCDRVTDSDPNPPVRLLQSCPTLESTSFGFYVSEAAVRGHQDPATTGRS